MSTLLLTKPAAATPNLLRGFTSQADEFRKLVNDTNNDINKRKDRELRQKYDASREARAISQNARAEDQARRAEESFGLNQEMNRYNFEQSKNDNINKMKDRELRQKYDASREARAIDQARRAEDQARRAEESFGLNQEMNRYNFRQKKNLDQLAQDKLNATRLANISQANILDQRHGFANQALVNNVNNMTLKDFNGIGQDNDGNGTAGALDILYARLKSSKQLNPGAPIGEELYENKDPSKEFNADELALYKANEKRMQQLEKAYSERNTAGEYFDAAYNAGSDVNHPNQQLLQAGMNEVANDTAVSDKMRARLDTLLKGQATARAAAIKANKPETVKGLLSEANFNTWAKGAEFSPESQKYIAALRIKNPNASLRDIQLSAMQAMDNSGQITEDIPLVSDINALNALNQKRGNQYGGVNTEISKEIRGIRNELGRNTNMSQKHSDLLEELRTGRKPTRIRKTGTSMKNSTVVPDQEDGKKKNTVVPDDRDIKRLNNMNKTWEDYAKKEEAKKNEVKNDTDTIDKIKKKEEFDRINKKYTPMTNIKERFKQIPIYDENVEKLIHNKIAELKNTDAYKKLGRLDQEHEQSKIINKYRTEAKKKGLMRGDEEVGFFNRLLHTQGSNQEQYNAGDVAEGLATVATGDAGWGISKLIPRANKFALIRNRIKSNTPAYKTELNSKIKDYVKKVKGMTKQEVDELKIKDRFFRRHYDKITRRRSNKLDGGYRSKTLSKISDETNVLKKNIADLKEKIATKPENISDFSKEQLRYYQKTEIKLKDAEERLAKLNKRSSIDELKEKKYK